MNSVHIIGRLTANTEVKFTQNGKAVCSFTIAVDDGFGDNKKAYFIRCVSWEKIAETVDKYCAKGHRIGISGKLTQRSYDKDGAKREAVEIVVFQIDLLQPKQQEKTSSEGGGYALEEDPGDLPF